MPDHRPVLLALHHQNENCHPDGTIKVGIAADIETVDEVVARLPG